MQNSRLLTPTLSRITPLFLKIQCSRYPLVWAQDIHILSSPHTACIPFSSLPRFHFSHLILIDFIRFIICDEENTLLNLLIVQFTPASCYFLKYFRRYPLPCYSLTATSEVPCPYEPTDRNYSAYIYMFFFSRTRQLMLKGYRFIAGTESNTAVFVFIIAYRENPIFCRHVLTRKCAWALDISTLQFHCPRNTWRMFYQITSYMQSQSEWNSKLSRVNL